MNKKARALNTEGTEDTEGVSLPITRTNDFRMEKIMKSKQIVPVSNVDESRFYSALDFFPVSSVFKVSSHSRQHKSHVVRLFIFTDPVLHCGDYHVRDALEG